MVTIIQGDCRACMAGLPAESVHCIVTSPPYWNLRDYGVDGQIGQEPTMAAWVLVMVQVFREARRVLRKDGTLWLNLGDSYASNGGTGSQGKTGVRAGRRHTQPGPPMRSDWRSGLKHKDLMGMPWRVALALQEDGWWLRNDVIWHKTNPSPETQRDRCSRAHEYLFLLSRSARYYFDQAAIMEFTAGTAHPRRAMTRPRGWNESGGHHCNYHPDGRAGVNPKAATHRPNDKQNPSWSASVTDVVQSRIKRTVWTIPTQPYRGAHFATFPPRLVEPCILAGCPAGGTVLDPFGGTGTVGQVAEQFGRNSILIELSPDSVRQATDRCGLFSRVANPGDTGYDKGN